MRAAFHGVFVVAAIAVSSGQTRAQSDDVDGYYAYGGPNIDDNEGGLRGELSVGVGYAYVAIGGSDSVLDSENALRFDPVLSFAPIEKLPQFRLGAAFGVSLVFDNSNRTIISDGGLVVVGSSDLPLWLFEPEVRASWRQYFGNEEQFYVEPGVGFGGVVAQLSLDANDTSSGQSFDESDAAFSGRGFLNVGFRTAGGVAGIQVSYMRGESLEFAENASGEVEQFYVGIFGSLTF